MSCARTVISAFRSSFEFAWALLERCAPYLACFIIFEGGFEFYRFMFGEVPEALGLRFIDRYIVDPASSVGVAFMTAHWLRSVQESWKIALAVAAVFVFVAGSATLRLAAWNDRLNMVEKGYCTPMSQFDPLNRSAPGAMYCPGDPYTPPATIR